ncbi:addiction module toxin, HicA family [Candidatus Woesebacteria bacterium RIFCSPHIGHO2_01_FULL_39_32]|uniref:Addiction module toxin, HicA family n=1 Tax=Candidatus Woesebacteria bacterium RIFCSPLOWO2_01_FULL_39_25 TaxID=1802521 RepID=A0A1F8BI63_9BACT|nr:MAG: addiction module toxin, HicA family [Candidatus Woesebacteria bacterium RIFCSPHIGHO2_01_FULL_39_32]OGM35577.1 MAG: addiction module toxin, HicA family [Candidatus Woesebacteria bacterium RIFCSPHIGHO2_12_FULL_38_11]OGM63722.1 MAG: addiction module toxin, HicA family [Candidatus Woesebacteria bacterium RIFCSPLOWO2_01_FULL_39_25]
MPRLPQISYRQFIKKLTKAGFKFYRQARGSHEIWFNPVSQRFVTVPKHSGKTFKKGTLKGMIDDMGITVKEFLNL